MIAVVLGLLLVYNTVTAIVTQQTAQIGELKAESNWRDQPADPAGVFHDCVRVRLLVATIPVMQGARITVRETISSYGLSGGGGWIDGLLARLRALPRVVSTALSNAVRNLGQVATTQLAMAGAGITFMVVVSARSSLVFTLGCVLLQSYPTRSSLIWLSPSRCHGSSRRHRSPA